MKTILVPALLVACAGMLNAAEPAPAQPRARRFYAEVGPAVARVAFTPEVSGVSGSHDAKSFYGIDAAFGTVFGRSSTGWHQAGLEVALTARNDDQGSTDVTNYFTSTLAVYNYHFNMAESATLYVGPCAGVAVLGRAVETSTGDSSDSDGALAAGVQAGLSAKCSDLVWLDFGYRFLAVDDIYLNKYASRYNDIRVHQVRAAVTFRF